MLHRLYIEQYAIIERLTLTFEKGLTVISGETGAGKSILLGALSLILGQRTEAKYVRDGANRCVVEAEFDLSVNDLSDYFAANDLEYVESSCLLRREVYSNGKSRAFINDSPVSLTALRGLALQLIDIHSQHQNLWIGKDAFQLDVLDTSLAKPTLIADYTASYQRFKALQTEWRSLLEASQQLKKEEDYLRFQLEQLMSAELKPDELESLEAEWSLLSHAEEIKISLGQVCNLLDSEGSGVLNALHQALSQTDQLNRHYPSIAAYSDRLRAAYIDLKDIASDLNVRQSDVEVDPKRLERINERINLLYSLQKKFRVNRHQDLMSLRDALNEQLSGIELNDDALNKLERAVVDAEKDAMVLACALSEARNQSKQALGDQLTQLVKPLGMPKAQLQIMVSPKSMDATGIDSVRFLFSANNGRLQPIEDIASGGEVARIMLCIKSIIAENMQLSTLVFDEIDTGISGEIAHRMGEIMREMAKNRQIICITHLPQIAAIGKYHYKVTKTDSLTSTQTTVTPLAAEDRLMEIAQMLSGANVTQAAVLNAKQLLAESN